MNIKTLTITNIVLAIAVVILFVMQLGSGRKEVKVADTPKKVEDLPKETASENEIIEKAFKIAYVNSDTVAAYYDFSKQMTTKLKSSQSSAESKLKGMYSKYEKQRKAFEAEAPIMGQEELQRKAQEIGVLEQTIMQKEQELSASLAKKEAAAMTDYVYQTDKFMQVIGKDLGYDYVMSYRVGGPMLYANPSLDITDKVVELLNIEYQKSRTPKQTTVE